MTDRFAERASTGPGRDAAPDDTAVRPPLRERVQARIGSVVEERRASAADASAGGATKAGGSANAKADSSATPGLSRPARRARLRLTRVDPWSVMKTAFLLSIAFGIVTIVSVLMVWSVLDAAGVWESINTSVRDIVGGEEARDFNVENYVGTSRVVGFTMLIAVVDVVLLTAIATLGAFLYNMAAALLGGIEVTLSEDN
ncbi:DUF3566 domain-containing protein [Nocardioides dongkuii]|uniref:DUF3566 domain-containing protein n=1 Tax=Nocardioides dongkuii TaxID=2760089 RepID=UPI0015FCF65C|nr:DUF3566 domain-containing protein [Nocardioides dongkuii]